MEYYDAGWDKVLAIFGLAGLSIVAVFAIAFCIVFSVTVINYILYRIPLYKMATTAGMSNSAIIWVPYCMEYVMAVLPRGEFQLFNNFLRIKKRANVYYLYLGISLGGGFVLGIINVINSVFSAATAGITGIITFPIIILITLVINVGLRLLYWRLYYDLFECFDPQNHSTNMTISIVGAFIPVVQLVYLYIMMNKAPSYGAGNYEQVQ